MCPDDLATAAASARAPRQVVTFIRWVGAGRKLTQTGQVTMADARHLVGLLASGDEVDPVIGGRVFRTRSSAELPGLAVVVAAVSREALPPPLRLMLATAGLTAFLVTQCRRRR
jgi:hypothetical protein